MAAADRLWVSEEQAGTEIRLPRQKTPIRNTAAPPSASAPKEIAGVSAAASIGPIRISARIRYARKYPSALHSPPPAALAVIRETAYFSFVVRGIYALPVPVLSLIQPGGRIGKGADQREQKYNGFSAQSLSKKGGMISSLQPLSQSSPHPEIDLCRPAG